MVEEIDEYQLRRKSKLGVAEGLLEGFCEDLLLFVLRQILKVFDSGQANHLLKLQRLLQPFNNLFLRTDHDLLQGGLHLRLEVLDDVVGHVRIVEHHFPRWFDVVHCSLNKCIKVATLKTHVISVWYTMH